MEGNQELSELLQSLWVWPSTNKKHFCGLVWSYLWVGIWVTPMSKNVCFMLYFFCFIWNSFRSIIFLLVFILSKLFCILSYVFMFLYVFIAVYVFFLWCVQNLLACACQKRAFDPLESELGMWVTMWVLGTETRSCPRATSTLNCWAISSIPFVMFLTFHFWELSWYSYSKS